MTHPLAITNGARSLAASILSIPDQFKTPSEIIRAANLIEKLDAKLPEDVATHHAWSVISAPLEVTEAQRDMLKAAVTSAAAKIPPSAHAVCLLSQLGFTE